MGIVPTKLKTNNELMNIDNLSNENEIPILRIGAVSSSACLRHKTNNMGYLQWHEWAKKKIKQGAKQKQCPKCGRWYFRNEY